MPLLVLILELHSIHAYFGLTFNSQASSEECIKLLKEDVSVEGFIFKVSIKVLQLYVDTWGTSYS